MHVGVAWFVSVSAILSPPRPARPTEPGCASHWAESMNVMPTPSVAA